MKKFLQLITALAILSVSVSVYANGPEHQMELPKEMLNALNSCEPSPENECLVGAVKWQCPGESFASPGMTMQKYSTRPDKAITRFTFNRMHYKMPDIPIAESRVLDPSAEFKFSEGQWNITVFKQGQSIEMTLHEFYEKYPTACDLPNDDRFVL